jgi:hypothetical protein
MKFEYPAFLFGFFLLVIPIIIHLFNFRRYKTIYFSSIRFLKQIDEETRSTQRLKHILVLISRLLLFSALILAFAQPYIPVDETAAEGSQPALAIYVDNSFSMSLQGTAGELLSEAREQARQMIENASEETLILLVTNEMDGIEQRFGTKADAIERLDKLKLSPLRRHIDEVVNWIHERFETYKAETKALGTKHVILLSDFQKSTARFDKLKAEEKSYHYPIQLIPQIASNVYVDSVWFSNPNFKTGVNNELSIRVRNSGEKDFTNLELQLDIAGSKRDVFLDVKANEYTTTTINFTDTKPGFKQAVISLNDKQFFEDDEFYFSYTVRDNTKIVIIDGVDAVTNIEKVYSLDQFYQISSISENAITPEKFKNVDLIVLNGLAEVSSGLAESCHDFLRNGGSLAVFPGEITDVNSYNSFLKKVGLPALGTQKTGENKLKSIQYSDKFFKGVFEKKPEKLSLPLLNKAYSVNSNGSTALSIIQLQNGSPLFVRSISGTNAYLFASSLKPSFGNFTSNALFSTLLLRMGELSHRNLPLYLTIGTDAKFPIYGLSSNEKSLILKSNENEFIPRVESAIQVSYLSITGIPSSKISAGNYDILEEQKIGVISLNYDRKESEIAFITEGEIKDKMLEKGLKNVVFSSLKNGQELTRIDISKPVEYWRIFVILALIFALVEMALLKFMK